MGLLQLAVVFSVIMALYNLQQMKIALKDKGYPVEMLTGWIRDYRQLKDLIRKEPDPKGKIKYQKILNGLHFSLAGLIFFVAMILSKRM
jgi:hypothetical protein